MPILRQACGRDADRVCALMNACLDQYYSIEVIGFFLDQWPTGQIIAEDVFGNLLGAVCGSRLGGGRASVSLLAVDEPFRRTGVGGMLMDAFRRRCLMEGVGAMQLEVRAENADAIRFYESRGFIRTEHLPRFYTDGGDAYRMTAFVSGCRSGRPSSRRVEEGGMVWVLPQENMLSSRCSV